MEITYLKDLAMELEVKGRRPVGRPKKTWSKVVEEDMKKIMIYVRRQKTVEATHITSDPRSGKLGTVNEDDDNDYYDELLSKLFVKFCIV